MTKTELDRLDLHLGLRRKFDPATVRILEHQHRADHATFRMLRTEMLGRLLPVVILTGAVVLAIIFFGLLSDIKQRSEASALEQYARAWQYFDGWVTPALALTVNIALMALVVSINVAVAAASSRVTRRDQVVSSLWRRMLEWCAIATACGAVVVGLLQSRSLSTHEDKGTASVAIFLGALTAFLAITLAGYVNSTDWVRNYTAACEHREIIVKWRGYLHDVGVPAILSVGEPVRVKTFWLHRIVRCGGVLAAFGLLSVIYTFGMSEAIALIGKRTFVVPRLSWQTAEFIALIWVYSSAVTCIVGYSAYRRWSTPIEKWRSARLMVRPIAVRVLYLSFALLYFVAIAAHQPDGGPVHWGRVAAEVFIVSGPFFLVPSVAWWAIWRSRKQRPGRAYRVARWLTEPIWHSVNKTLLDSYRNNTARRDHAYDNSIEDQQRAANAWASNAGSLLSGGSSSTREFSGGSPRAFRTDRDGSETTRCSSGVWLFTALVAGLLGMASIRRFPDNRVGRPR